MSANGTFSSTLDYEFFGGGFTIIRGGASGSIDFAIDSTSKVYINGQLSNLPLSFDFNLQARMPGIFATLEQSIDFTLTSTIEFGVQSYAEANNRIDFTFDTMFAYNLTHGYLDLTIPFNLTFTADQFSLANTSGLYDFSFGALGTNRSTHTYDRIGRNEVIFRDNYNNVLLRDNFTDIELRKDGITGVKILPPT